MKKVLSLILALVMCLSLCACGGGNSDTPETTEAPTESKRQSPTVEAVVEGIKNEFKDPDSVQVSDGTWARVKVDGEESDTEFYIICTVRAKNSFGGYGDPQEYIIHCKNGMYRIVEEFDGTPRQKKFNELGCGASMGLKSEND